MSDQVSTQLGNVYFEFVQIGGQVRVCAIHEETRTEAMVIAPVQATQHHMQQLALGKLRRMLEKRRD